MEEKKIIAFEVREDEIETFRRMEQEYSVKIECYREILDKKNVELVNGTTMVSTLGMSRFDKEMLCAVWERGVKYISTRTVGYNHIDLEEAKRLKMTVSNVSYAPNGVADYAVMLILMSLRHYKQALFRGNVNDYSLEGLQGKEMRNLTIGVVGTGKIGAQVITNLQGFGSRILAYDVYENPGLKGMAEYVSLERLYRESDVITLHTPLLDSTWHMINKDSIDRMKRGVMLVNCARGPLIDLPDLIEAVEKKKVGAVALDVVEHEEGIYHRDRRSDIIQNRDMAYLRQFPNVVMTQHMAFYTREAVDSMVSGSVKNLLQCVSTGNCEMALP